MSKRSDSLTIEQMIEFTEKIISYTQDLTYDEFCNHTMAIDAVIRNFEVLGEAANRLTDSFKESHSEIDWFKIRGMRNRLIHDYDNIDFSTIWDTIQNRLPELLIGLKKIQHDF